MQKFVCFLLFVYLFFVVFSFCLFATFFQDLLMASLLVKNREQSEMLKDYARRLLKKSNMIRLKLFL